MSLAKLLWTWRRTMLYQRESSWHPLLLSLKFKAVILNFFFHFFRGVICIWSDKFTLVRELCGRFSRTFLRTTPSMCVRPNVYEHVNDVFTNRLQCVLTQFLTRRDSVTYSASLPLPCIHVHLHRTWRRTILYQRESSWHPLLLSLKFKAVILNFFFHFFRGVICIWSDKFTLVRELCGRFSRTFLRTTPSMCVRPNVYEHVNDVFTNRLQCVLTQFLTRRDSVT